MKVALAQINTTVGDLEGNVQRIEQSMDRATSRGAHVVVFPELAVTGYPPQDLLFEKEFIRMNIQSLKMMTRRRRKTVAVIGFVDLESNRLFNSAAVIAYGRNLGVVHKTLLPTYDIFDEARYFSPGTKREIRPISIQAEGKEINLGVEICEDLWDKAYDVKVTDVLAARGADMIVNLSASPFYAGKWSERLRILKRKAIRNGVPMFYANLVGGQDELVFDGGSLAVDCRGNLIAASKRFEEDLTIVEIDPAKGRGTRVSPPIRSQDQEMFDALVLGVRDYFRKTGFQRAVVAMSGGIDSSVSACIAVEALGNANVIGVWMPSRFSSQQGRIDVQTLAHNLGIFLIEFSIEGIVDAYHRSLEEPLEQIRSHYGVGKENDDPVADENIQPRVRGNCLMDISNRLKQLGILMLNTGNKTELGLGYCTLYGDMAGGIGALGDVSKLEVYRLAHYVNCKSGKDLIPRNVMMKRPSPELRENHYDPFDFSIISPLVDDIIEKRMSKGALIRKGYRKETVDDTYDRIRRAEYKRRQSVPSIKVTRTAFGIGWRMPIVNKFKV